MDLIGTNCGQISIKAPLVIQNHILLKLDLPNIIRCLFETVTIAHNNQNIIGFICSDYKGTVFTKNLLDLFPKKTRNNFL